MADAKSIAVSQLKRYRLCRDCAERQGSRQKPGEPCYVCRGLFDQKDTVLKRMVSAASGYEYDTFLIGAMLPTQIYEREDAMRARLKIRGRESAKSQLTRELGIAFATANRKKVDYMVPDLVINLVVDKENNIEVSTKSRPLTLQGRYKKNAPGLAQKQVRCPSCEGKGCSQCGHSGLSGFDSIEGVLAKQIMSATKGQTPKFSWVGSEDRSSLVLGKGRPFYAKVFDPRKRKLRKIIVNNNSVVATLSPMKRAIVPSPFAVKTKIQIRCDKNILRDDLRKLKSLTGTKVKFDNRTRIGTKKIYTAISRRIDDNTFALTILADGGLMIKQFVGGQEYMKPNISELVGAKCDCVTFDILDVRLQDSHSSRFQYGVEN